MKGALLAIHRYRVPIYAAACVFLLVVILSRTFFDVPARAVYSILIYLALGVMALCLLVVFFGSRLLPNRVVRNHCFSAGEKAAETDHRAERGVVVGSPVRGRWVGVNSPATKVPSHGIRMYGQAYAIDLTYEPEGVVRPVFGSGPALRKPEEYPAFGEPVFAMVGGAVVRASDWRRDHRARSRLWSILYMMLEGALRELGGVGFILGNHVTIRNGEGIYATVAHLQQGSLAVRVGDVVQPGQQIGRCGNSGNSSEPHVHAQLMDRVNLYTAQGIPMVFAGVSLDDNADPVDGLPGNGERMVA